MKFSEYRMLNCVATGIICALMLSGCGGYGKGGVSGEGITASPAPTSGAEDVTVPELTPGVETASSLTPTAVPGQSQEVSSAPELDQYQDCPVFSPCDGVSVYFVEDGKKQVVVRAGEKEALFDWEYDLGFGEPIFYHVEKNGNKLLYLALPTEGCGDKISVSSREICGEYHVVRLGGTGNVQLEEVFLAEDEAREDFWMEWEENENGGYPVLHSGIDRGMNTPSYAYPALYNMEQEHYELIKEESLHITDRMLAYRRVGVRAGDDVVWLGAMFDDLLVKDESRMNSKSSVGRGCFVPDAVAAYGEEWFGKWRQSGELLMLAPDALLDLDGDGINERISLRVEAGNKTGTLSVTTSTGECISTVVGDDGVQCDFRPFAVSLDGSTVQLVVEQSNGILDVLAFYCYEGEELKSIGTVVCHDYKYAVTGRAEDGGLKFSAKDLSGGIRLGDFAVMKDYVYEDQQIKEVVPEFYDILDGGDYFIYPKMDITVSKNMDGAGGIIFRKGSRVRRIQCSELELFPPEEKAENWGWVLLENMDTGEFGWYQVASALECFLPDGKIVDCGEVFDGIKMAN